MGRGGGEGKIGSKGEDGIPLLDFVESWKERDGNEDDYCFLAVTDFDLYVAALASQKWKLFKHRTKS